MVWEISIDNSAFPPPSNSQRWNNDSVVVEISWTGKFKFHLFAHFIFSVRNLTREFEQSWGTFIDEPELTLVINYKFNFGVSKTMQKGTEFRGNAVPQKLLRTVTGEATPRPSYKKYYRPVAKQVPKSQLVDDVTAAASSQIVGWRKKQCTFFVELEDGSGFSVQAQVTEEQTSKMNTPQKKVLGVSIQSTDVLNKSPPTVRSTKRFF